MFDRSTRFQLFSPSPALQLVWLGVFLLLSVFTACKPTIDSTVTEYGSCTAEAPEDTEPTPVEQSAASPLPHATAAKPLQEYWEKHLLRGSRIGYAHFVVEEVPAEMEDPDLKTLIRTTSLAESVVERIGQPVTQTMILRSWDTPAGELVRFEAEMDDGSEKKISRGTVSASRNTLNIEVQTAGKTEEFMLPWKPDYRGFFGVEQSLKAKPLKPGEERTVFALLPMINIVAENRLHATTDEAVSLPGGAEELLKLNGTTIIPLPGGNDQRFETALWMNDRGEILKSEMSGLQQITLRASREQALAKETAKPAIDLIEESVVKVTPPLEHPLQTKRVLYRAKVNDGSLNGVFSEGLSQHVKMIDDQTAEIEVLAVNLATELPKNLTIPEPFPGDLASNGLIQADDPRIVAMGRRLRASNNFGIARDLESIVNRSIRKKNFSKAFASAAEVVRTLEGDCTEHAVLLAATCRAREIPARVAIGLVYYPPKQGFAYHMWNEVWTGDRWIPLDATLGEGQVTADRIKLADSNLEGANAYSALLPVVQVFGRLQLEILEVE